MPKEYLGDGVYVDWEGEMLVLTTSNGERTTNEIFLEPAVYSALVGYVERSIVSRKLAPQPEP